MIKQHAHLGIAMATALLETRPLALRGRNGFGSCEPIEWCGAHASKE